MNDLKHLCHTFVEIDDFFSNFLFKMKFTFPKIKLERLKQTMARNLKIVQNFIKLLLMHNVRRKAHTQIKHKHNGIIVN